jgi:hypothetical protein
MVGLILKNKQRPTHSTLFGGFPRIGENYPPKTHDFVLRYMGHCATFKE